MYKRYETVYRNKHYNNLINNLFSINYDEIIYDTLCCIYVYSNSIAEIYSINSDYIKDNIRHVVEKKFMIDYYDYIYSLIKNKFKT